MIPTAPQQPGPPPLRSPPAPTAKHGGVRCLCPCTRLRLLGSRAGLWVRGAWRSTGGPSPVPPPEGRCTLTDAALAILLELELRPAPAPVLGHRELDTVMLAATVAHGTGVDGWGHAEGPRSTHEDGTTERLHGQRVARDQLPREAPGTVQDHQGHSGPLPLSSSVPEVGAPKGGSGPVSSPRLALLLKPHTGDAGPKSISILCPACPRTGRIGAAERTAALCHPAQNAKHRIQNPPENQGVQDAEA